jgi:hypothetical protein
MAWLFSPIIGLTSHDSMRNQIGLEQLAIVSGAYSLARGLQSAVQMAMFTQSGGGPSLQQHRSPPCPASVP